MARRGGESSAVADGINSSIEFSGQTYYVQTQCSKRDAPIIESLVYQGGQTLIRFTSSYDDIASRYGFTGDDGRHLLQLQHANLIQKIRHGLLRNNDTEREQAADTEEEAHLVDSNGVVVDPAEVDDPSVLELLQELGVAVDAALDGTSAEAPARALPERPAPAPTRVPSPPSPQFLWAVPLPWWRRRMSIVICLPRRRAC